MRGNSQRLVVGKGRAPCRYNRSAGLARCDGNGHRLLIVAYAIATRSGQRHAGGNGLRDGIVARGQVSDLHGFTVAIGNRDAHLAIGNGCPIHLARRIFVFRILDRERVRPVRGVGFRARTVQLHGLGDLQAAQLLVGEGRVDVGLLRRRAARLGRRQRAIAIVGQGDGDPLLVRVILDAVLGRVIRIHASGKDLLDHKVVGSSQVLVTLVQGKADRRQSHFLLGGVSGQINRGRVARQQTPSNRRIAVLSGNLRQLDRKAMTRQLVAVRKRLFRLEGHAAGGGVGVRKRGLRCITTHGDCAARRSSRIIIVLCRRGLRITGNIARFNDAVSCARGQVVDGQLLARVQFNARDHVVGYSHIAACRLFAIRQDIRIAGCKRHAVRRSQGHSEGELLVRNPIAAEIDGLADFQVADVPVVGERHRLGSVRAHRNRSIGRIAGRGDAQGSQGLGCLAHGKAGALGDSIAARGQAGDGHITVTVKRQGRGIACGTRILDRRGSHSTIGNGDGDRLARRRRHALGARHSERIRAVHQLLERCCGSRRDGRAVHLHGFLQLQRAGLAESIGDVQRGIVVCVRQFRTASRVVSCDIVGFAADCSRINRLIRAVYLKNVVGAKFQPGKGRAALALRVQRDCGSLWGAAIGDKHIVVSRLCKHADRDRLALDRRIRLRASQRRLIDLDPALAGLCVILERRTVGDLVFKRGTDGIAGTRRIA